MSSLLFHGGTIVLPDRLLDGASVRVEDSRIARVADNAPAADAEVIELAGGYLAPGYIDLHVHGGAGADFMDGTPEAFQTVCRAHARHGTTRLTATSTVARHEQILSFLKQCRRLRSKSTGGAVVLGAHFYGPYFAPEARG